MSDNDEKLIDITKHPSFKLNAKALDFQSMTGDDVASGMWSSEVKAFMEMSTLKGLFFHEAWVFNLVDLVADHVSASPLRVWKSEVVKNKERNARDDDHIVNLILENPNQYQSYDSWMYNYGVEYCLMGNVVMWRAKRNNHLLIMPADSILLDFNSKGEHNGYIFAQTNQQEQGSDLVGQQRFDISEIWHQRRPNPNSMLWGLSPFIPNRKSILFSRYTQDYLNSFYLKGATPGLVLSMEKHVSEDSALRFLRSFEMAHTGRRNQRRTLMLPKGVTATPITPSLGDQNIVEVVKTNREEIINILRVPKHALSLAESGSLGSEEHKQALKFFFQSAIMPIQRKIAGFLTRQFQNEGLLERDRYLEFDNSAVEALQEDMLHKATLGQALLTQWTLNEIRERLWELPPTEDGDRIGPAPMASPFGAMPNFDYEDDEQEQEQEIESVPEPEVEQDDDQEKHLAPEQIKKIEAIRRKFKDISAVNIKQNEAEVEDKEKAIVGFWLDTFAEMTKRAVTVTRRSLERQSKKSLHTKADDDKPASVPPKRQFRRELMAAMTPLSEGWEKTAENVLMTSVETGYGQQLGMVFNAQARDAIEVLRVRDEGKRKRLLGARSIDAFQHVSRTMTDKIMDVVSKGVANNQTIQQIARQITDTSKNTSPGKAMTIARTEVLTAVSIGKSAAMENTAEVIPDLKKVWLNANDDRVRGNPDGQYSDSKADHWVLQAETVDHDQPFSNGLMFPRDPNADEPGEVINCRCDFLLVPPEDLDDLDI